jgi:hypothetical protein
MSNGKHTYPKMNTRMKSNYIEEPKIATKMTNGKRHQQMKQAIKDSKNQIGERYYDKIKQVF